MSDQHQPPHDLPDRADAQNAWSLGISPNSIGSHNYGQARLGSAPSYPFGGPDLSRRNTNRHLSRYHYNGMPGLSTGSSEAGWPDKIFTINSGHSLLSMERVPEISSVFRKRHDPLEDSSTDGKDPPSMMRAHPPLIRSSTDPFPRGTSSDPYFRRQETTLGSSLGFPPSANGSENVNHYRWQFPPLGLRDPAHFIPATAQQYHHDQNRSYHNVDTSDNAQPRGLNPSRSPSDSGDELSSFHKTKDESDRRSPNRNESRDSVLPDILSLDIGYDTADMSKSHPSSPNSWNVQFAQHWNDEPGSLDGNAVSERKVSQRKKKKSKMHECPICNKLFPRPSGLRTHENSHTGNKPFLCQYPKCTRAFAVRSNAKRHLRTHGIVPEQSPDTRTLYTVGFEPPVVQSVEHPRSKVPTRLRWVPSKPPPTALNTASRHVSTTTTGVPQGDLGDTSEITWSFEPTDDNRV